MNIHPTGEVRLYCTIWLLPKPKIDYTLKAVGGSLTAIPGLSDMIDVSADYDIKIFIAVGFQNGWYCYVDLVVLFLPNWIGYCGFNRNDMLQWPPEIVVPIGGIAVDTRKAYGVIVKANDLKNMEMIGKSYPYVVVYIRPLFKVKTKVIDNDLNPIWNQTFGENAQQCKGQTYGMFPSSCSKFTDLLTQVRPDLSHDRISGQTVFDEDVGQDKRLGIAKLKLIELEAETPKEVEVRLLPSLDMLKIKDKKARGTLTVKVHISIYVLRSLLHS
ncbi:Synaptotagmin-4 [Camellia lanceoleosa]|nr:Synaptotagmin-4 [Camellia lanceoleosa]